MKNRHAWLLAAAALAGATILVACGDDDDTTIDTPRDLGTDAGPGTDLGTDLGTPVDLGPPVDLGDVDLGSDPDLGVDGGPPVPTCPDVAARTVVEVTADISTPTTWTCGNIYHFTDFVFVRSVLTIEPGTLIRGGNTRVGATGGDVGALIVTKTGRLEASGTAAQPIVFTSDELTTPRAGDWGGIALLGAATTNFSPGDLSDGVRPRGTIEGLNPDTYGEDVRYGGTNDAHNCGTVRYVRIEYAGFQYGPNNELNSLTAAACGSATTFDYIETIYGLDDGIEWFGGTMNAKHLVVVGQGDDSLDYDEGFRGKFQHVIVWQRGGDGEDRFIEADNLANNNSATPQSTVTLFNGTFIGPPAGATAQNGAYFRRGASGFLNNSLLLGTPKSIITVDGRVAAANATAATPLLDVTTSIGRDFTVSLVATRSNTAPDDIPDTAAVVAALTPGFIDLDPGVTLGADVTAPNFVPATAGVGTMGTTPPADGFFDANTHIGAVAPGTATPWYAGWTRFPAAP